MAEAPHTYHPTTTIQCHPTMRQLPLSTIIILRPLRVISLQLLHITPLPLSWLPQPSEEYSTLPPPHLCTPRKRPRCVWSTSWQGFLVRGPRLISQPVLVLHLVEPCQLVDQTHRGLFLGMQRCGGGRVEYSSDGWGSHERGRGVMWRSWREMPRRGRRMMMVERGSCLMVGWHWMVVVGW